MKVTARLTWPDIFHLMACAVIGAAMAPAIAIVKSFLFMVSPSKFEKVFELINQVCINQDRCLRCIEGASRSSSLMRSAAIIARQIYPAQGVFGFQETLLSNLLQIRYRLAKSV
jgi:hypothetical protein